MKNTEEIKEMKWNQLPKRNKIAIILLSIIIFLVPSIIVRGDFYLVKSIVLLCCGAALLCFFLWNFKHNFFDFKDKILLCFGGLAILSCVFSVHLPSSLWGANTRYEGIFAILTYLLIYYHAKYYFKNTKYFRITALVIYSLILIFMIVQYYWPSGVRILPFLGKGTHGTFGNTNFAGSFVSLILPTAFLLYLHFGNIEYLFASGLGFYGAMICLARSSWLALCCSLILILIYCILKKDKLYWKRILILGITFACCFGIIRVSKNFSTIRYKISNIERDFNALQELQELSLLEDTADLKRKDALLNSIGSSRVAIYRLCLQLLPHVPLLGCGVDALTYGFIKYNVKEFVNFCRSYAGYPDKAHCEPLHIACTMGIPAVILYLLFLALIEFPILCNFHKDKFSFIFSVIIASYFIQSLFNISVISVAPIFWFVIGLSENYRISKCHSDSYE